jgi:tRNA threonylcarbamoyladenosine biosynthesis protein TsaB
MGAVMKQSAEPMQRADRVPMDRVLAIETSGREGSVALGLRRETVATASFRSDRGHGAELVPTIAALFESAGWPAVSLDACFVSVGPGSFTGLRIGITLARTLAWSVGVRLVSVPTMEVIASNALELLDAPEHIAVVLDAKRGNVYGGLLRRVDGAYACIESPHETDVASWLRDAPRPLAAAGDGVTVHRQTLERVGATILPVALWTPRADAVLRLGWRLADAGRFVEATTLVPVYIRLPSAVEKLQIAQNAQP